MLLSCAGMVLIFLYYIDFVYLRSSVFDLQDTLSMLWQSDRKIILNLIEYDLYFIYSYTTYFLTLQSFRSVSPDLHQC